MLIAPWCGLILASNVQLGNLEPGPSSADDVGGPVNPRKPGGIAEQGRQVYIEMGCVYCHTQQIRPESAELELLQTVKTKDGSVTKNVILSPDIARGWGKRGTVPRDYIYQDRPLLGFVRYGPDLADVGDRPVSAADSDWLYIHLYDAQSQSPGSTMPPFRFLFTMKKINGLPSPDSLKLPISEPVKPLPGYELVPTDRAKALVAYLRSLKVDYELEEAKFAP
jgi:cytochrome c oxidase cbb3-type subunit 2